MAASKEVSALTKALRLALGKFDVNLGHQQAQHVIAEIMQETSYHVLSAKLKKLREQKQSSTPTAAVRTYQPCKACGEHLLFGFCSDETCIYHDWSQVVLEDSYEDLLERYGQSARRIRINAEIHSDDHAYEVEFDAMPWFLQASNGEIKALYQIEWRGGYAADRIAEDLPYVNNEVAAVFSHIYHVSTGFEVSVNADQAMLWLKFHRTQLWAQIICDQEEVRLVQAQEDEVLGRWDWIREGDASDMSYETIGEAAMNAVLVLGLDRQGVSE